MTTEKDYEKTFDETSAPKKLSPKDKKKLLVTTILAVSILIIVLTLSGSGSKKNKTQPTTVTTSEVIEKTSIDKELEYVAAQKNLNSPVAMSNEEQELYSTNQTSLIPGNGSNPIDPQTSYEPNIRPSVQEVNYSNRGSSSAAEYEYRMPTLVKKRTSSDYQSMVSHFKETKNFAWELEDITKENANDIALIETPLQELYDGANAITNRSFSVTIPAGTRLTLVTDNEVNSDYPGAFTASIVRPFELKGAKMILESSSNQRDRIPVQPTKIVWNNKEYVIAGQVEMTYPGLEGSVKSHVMKRMGPALANAAIGGAFSAWILNNSSDSDVRIDTRDAIAAPVIERSVTGVQDEISRLGGDYPNTVKVPAGTEFRILLIQKITISR